MPSFLAALLGLLGMIFMGGAKSSSPASMEAPKPPPAPPSREDALTSARERLAAERGRQGYASTLLTGPAGLVEEPTLAKRFLLG